MRGNNAYNLIADAVLAIHFAIVVFVVGGLVLIILGNLIGWRWVNSWWLRLSHLGAIAFVVAQSWLGITCPLTTLESWLRERAGAAAYEKGFVEDWVGRLLFYHAPSWVFAMLYTVFGLLVITAWWRFPPRRAVSLSTTAATTPDASSRPAS